MVKLQTRRWDIYCTSSNFNVRLLGNWQNSNRKPGIILDISFPKLATVRLDLSYIHMLPWVHALKAAVDSSSIHTNVITCSSGTMHYVPLNPSVLFG